MFNIYTANKMAYSTIKCVHNIKGGTMPNTGQLKMTNNDNVITKKKIYY